MPQLFELTLNKRIPLTDQVSHFEFDLDPLKAKIFTFVPGQFIRLYIPNPENKNLSRSYSLANNSWDPKGKLTLAASYIKDGVASEYLFNLKQGEKVRTTGPFGRLILKPEDDPNQYILMATNTGVTPYRAMLPALERKINANPKLKVLVLQGIRGQSDKIYVQDFLDFQAKYPMQFEFKLCLSKDQPAAPHEYAGYVQSNLNESSFDVQNDIVYLCGNPNMVDDSFEKFKSLGFEVANIRREKYISPPT